MTLYELHYGKDGKNRYERFLSVNEERILSLLPREISRSLSFFHLYGGMADERELFEELGLVKAMDVTPRGSRILSATPLFGRGLEKKPLSQPYFFHVLSSLLVHRIVAPGWKSFLSSSSILSLFPSMDDNALRARADAFFSLLSSLSYIDGRGRIKGKGIAFLSSLLSLEPMALHWTLFALISAPSAASGTLSKSISEISMLSGLPWSEAEGIISCVNRKYHLSLKLSTLVTLGLVYVEDGLCIASAPPALQPSFTIDSSLTVVTSTVPGKLWLFAFPLKCDIVSEWRVNRESVRRALEAGMDKDDIPEAIRSSSSYPVPRETMERIGMLNDDALRIRVDRVCLLRTDSRTAEVITRLPLFSSSILSRLGDGAFIMDGAKREWRETLSEHGFAALGAEGTEEEEDDAVSPYIPSFTLLPPPLPQSRGIPFKEDLYRRVSSSLSKTPLMSALFSSCCIFSSRESVDPGWTDGLDYPLLKALAEDAAAHRSVVALENTDGDVRVVRASATRDEDGTAILETDKGPVALHKVWRISILPSWVGTVRRET